MGFGGFFDGDFAFGAGGGGVEGDGRVVGFELFQDLFGPVDDRLRDAGEAGDLDSVAAVGGAGDHLADEDDFVVPFFDRHREVAEAGEGFVQLGQFVIMSREHRAGSEFRVEVEVLDHGPGDAESIVGAGAAADFVEDDEAAGGRVVENVGGFVHFHHEGGVAAGKFVAGSDAGEYAVDEADVTRFRRDPGTYLGHEGDQGDLPDVGRFSGHVGAGEEHDLVRGGVERGVVGNEGEASGEAEVLCPDGLLDDGVASFNDFEGRAFVEFGAAVVPLAGDSGPTTENIEFREGFGGGAEGFAFGEDGGNEVGKEFLFAGFGFFLGVENFFFFFLQFLGVVALGVDGGLAADVVIGNEVEVRFRDFYEVAKRVVELDLEAFDPGFPLFVALEVGEPGFVVGGE